MIKKIFYEVRNVPWLDKTMWEEWNHTGFDFKGKKEMKERKRETRCLCYFEVFLVAVETCCLWNKDIKDVNDRMPSD